MNPCREWKIVIWRRILESGLRLVGKGDVLTLYNSFKVIGVLPVDQFE